MGNKTGRWLPGSGGRVKLQKVMQETFGVIESFCFLLIKWQFGDYVFFKTQNLMPKINFIQGIPWLPSGQSLVLSLLWAPVQSLVLWSRNYFPHTAAKTQHRQINKFLKIKKRFLLRIGKGEKQGDRYEHSLKQ